MKQHVKVDARSNSSRSYLNMKPLNSLWTSWSRLNSLQLISWSRTSYTISVEFILIPTTTTLDLSDFCILFLIHILDLKVFKHVDWPLVLLAPVASIRQWKIGWTFSLDTTGSHLTFSVPEISCQCQLSEMTFPGLPVLVPLLSQSGPISTNGETMTPSLKCRWLTRTLITAHGSIRSSTVCLLMTIPGRNRWILAARNTTLTNLVIKTMLVHGTCLLTLLSNLQMEGPRNNSGLSIWVIRTIFWSPTTFLIAPLEKKELAIKTDH